MESDKLTIEEQVTNNETRIHIQRVAHYLNEFIKTLLCRAEHHDRTKLEHPEVEIFAKYTQKLKGLTYGSDEYKQCLAEMKPALDHHYQCNFHHPECYANGIDGMTLIDLIEMYCDWVAAGERHANGNFHRSLEVNQGRFGMSDQLVKIFENTYNYDYSEEL
jgi:hypothetical protein